MTYEVRKGGRTYMSTRHESCRYPPTVEATVQAAGYDIFVDGKRQKKARPTKAGWGDR
jgi:hypothetical protein